MTQNPPAHWQIVAIADVAAKRQHSLVIGPFGSDLKTSDYVDHGVPIVFVRDVQEHRFVPKDRQYLSEHKAEQLRAHAVYPGDLVITKMGLPPCLTAIYPKAEPPGIVTADIIKMSVDETVACREYVARYLNTDLARAQVSGITFGVTRPKVTLRDFKEIRLPLPPLQEQRRIADLLDRADALRAQRRAALGKLDELVRAAFVDMFGDPATNDKRWQTKSLKELGRVVTGSTPPSAKTGMFGGAIPFVTPGDLESDEAVRRTVTEDGAAEVGTVRAGAALVCCIGATIGKMGKAQERCAFNQQINAVEWSNRINDDYGINSLRFLKRLIVQSGTSTTLPIIKKSLFERIEIPVPSLTLQQEFSRRIAAIETLKSSHRASLAELDALFASLQHRAFRGEL